MLCGYVCKVGGRRVSCVEFNTPKFEASRDPKFEVIWQKALDDINDLDIGNPELL